MSVAIRASRATSAGAGMAATRPDRAAAPPEKALESQKGPQTGNWCPTMASMQSQAGDELTDLEHRQEPRLVRALEMGAPGTALREGLDNILNARTGALLAIGDSEELSFLYSGGIKLDIDYTPALLYQVAKMDGAIILNSNGTKICGANVQLMPDPTIMSLETGTPSRTRRSCRPRPPPATARPSASRSRRAPS